MGNLGNARHEKDKSTEAQSFPGRPAQLSGQEEGPGRLLRELRRGWTRQGALL